MIDPGQRDRLITFQRNTVTTDDHGGDVEGWDEVAQAWAKVLYGTGQERREAAQTRAGQAATFICLNNPTTAAVVATDRIQFDGAAWDITSRALVGREEIHFTALRSE